MISYCALAILAVLVGANADTTNQPCSKQLELKMRCEVMVQSSPEANLLKDRVKETLKTCAPDYPKECVGQMEAAHDCILTTAKNADTDPLLIETKNKSAPAVDQCFEKYPPNLMAGFMEIFMPMKPKGHGGWKHRNRTSASGESASGESGNETASGFERRRGKGCRPDRHHRRRGPGSSEGKSNETSSSQSASKERKRGGGSGGMSGGKSGEGHGMDSPQCRKTPEQYRCLKEEMKKLAADPAFMGVMNTLIRQKHKCKQIVDWSCTPKNPKQKKCVFKAMKPCFDAFMLRVATCLKEKGFTLPPFMMQGDRTSPFTTPLPVLHH